MIDPISDLRHLRSERIDWLLTVLTGVLIRALFYMSFVTLTSTGYGDIVPVHPFAGSICNIESVIVQLYPARRLARLFTLELRGPCRS
jgi:hypothetical protein